MIRDRDFRNSTLIDLDPQNVVCRPWPVVDPTVAVAVKIEDRLFELLGVFDKSLEKVSPGFREFRFAPFASPWPTVGPSLRDFVGAV